MDRHAGQTIRGPRRPRASPADGTPSRHVPTRREIRVSLRRLGVRSVSLAPTRRSAHGHGAAYGVAQGLLGVDACGRRLGDEGEQAVTEVGRLCRGRARHDVGHPLEHLGRRAAAPAAPAAMPSYGERLAFSSALIRCHCWSTSAAVIVVGSVGPKTCGLRRCIFSADPAGDVVDGEVARLLGDDRHGSTPAGAGRRAPRAGGPGHRCRSPRPSRRSPPGGSARASGGSAPASRGSRAAAGACRRGSRAAAGPRSSLSCRPGRVGNDPT